MYHKLSEFILMCENQMNKSIQVVRSDNSKKFVNNKIIELLIYNGIEHQTSVTYNPQQNERAKQEMRAIIEEVKIMLVAKNVVTFWA